ncbi:MAG: putative Ig domain-containing protein [Acidimicrobiales bacterium]
MTSATAATFTTTLDTTFDVTTTGYPAAALSETGALPSGLTFADNGNGTGALSGTPAVGSQGSYPVTITAANSADNSSVTQSVTITVNPATAPSLALPAADFTLNQTGAVAVTAAGYPTPSITETGTLPAGLNFTDNGNGTALVSGTPTSNGTTAVTITATNAIGTTSQTFDIQVGESPAITSAASASATVGSPLSFTVTTSGYPAPSLAASGMPASGDFTFTDNGNGTATISGTPKTADIGNDSVDITTTNTYGTSTQTLALSVAAAAPVTPVSPGSPPVVPVAPVSPVSPPVAPVTPASGTGPAFTSSSSATAVAGKASAILVTASGVPAAAITEAGSLPAGVTFTAYSNGTATLAGKPGVTAGGVYPLTFTANNSNGSASQSFSLTVNQSPSFSSAASATKAPGTAFSFAVTTKGYPTPTLTSSALPAGVAFKTHGNGTATITGARSMKMGTYTIALRAKNSAGTTAQTFVLKVLKVPAITSAASAKAVRGHTFRFTFKSTGYPMATITRSGSVRGMTFTTKSNGTATLSGKPTVVGTYRLAITAKNSVGSASQTFTLTVR